MARNLLSFQWVVKSPGYQWVKVRPRIDVEGDPAIIARVLRNLGQIDEAGRGILPALAPMHGLASADRLYQPLRDESGLFRTFAALGGEDDFLAFANRFGALGGDAEVPIRQQHDPSVFKQLEREYPNGILPPDLRDVWLKVAEPIGKWLTHSTAMHAAVSLWDAVRAQDEQQLAQHIHWQGRGDHLEVTCDFPDAPAAPFSEVIASAEETPETLQRLQHGEVFGPAKLFIERVLQETLHGRVSVQPRWIEGKNGTRIDLVPDSLLAAMWLQLALAVEGDRQFRACPVCGRWYEVSSQFARKSRQFCRDACRVAAHRQRQAALRADVLALRLQGKTVSHIARQLKVDADTIKTWIDEAKEK